MKTQERPTRRIRIRELMPPSYTTILNQRTGKAAPTVSLVVRGELDTNEAVWPEVLKLAEETDPVMFALYLRQNAA